MTRYLVFKLVLAFLVVSVTGAVLTAVFARWATWRTETGRGSYHEAMCSPWQTRTATS
jgi:hypothetical protein